MTRLNIQMERARMPRMWGWMLGLLAGYLVSVLSAGIPVRTLPDRYFPGVPFTVLVEVKPETVVQLQLIEERLPEGWQATAVSHGGIWDVRNNSVKWGPFDDSVRRILSYMAHPPSGSAPGVTFIGEGWFNGAKGQTGGNTACSGVLGTLQRTQPSAYFPGETLVVMIEAVPSFEVETWAVRERVPEGWGVSDISHNGTFDTLNRMVKWGPYTDAVSRALQYTLHPPDSARQNMELSALGYFDMNPTTDIVPLPIAPSGVEVNAPSDYLPNVPLTVDLVVLPAPYIRGIHIEVAIPQGWAVDGLKGGGVLDGLNNSVKWAFPDVGDPDADAIGFKLVPPDGATVDVLLRSVVAFDESIQVVEHWIERRLAVPVSRVERSLPPFFVPNQAVEVQLDVYPVDTALVQTVMEDVPEGWTVVSMSNGGAFDPFHRQIKWGPFIEDPPEIRTLNYTLMSPASGLDPATFSGVGRFDRVEVPVTGDQQLDPIASKVRRSLPPGYAPGRSMPVSLSTDPVAGTYSHAVEEEVPGGWTVGGISDGGAWDPHNRRIKWGPFADDHLRVLHYVLTPPENANGTYAVAGRGFFNTGWVETTEPSMIPMGAPPVAGPDTLYRPTTVRVLKVLAADLLANDSDPDNDPLSIIGVGDVSPPGATVMLSGAFIVYTAPSLDAGHGAFTYTLSDGPGGYTTTGHVTVLEGGNPDPNPSPNTPPNAVRVGLSSGVVRIEFLGVPGRRYTIRYADSLTSPVIWRDFSPPVIQLAAPNGVFSVSDTVSDDGFRIYRALLAP